MAFNQEGFITITDLVDGLAGVGTTVEFAYTLNAGSKDEVGDPASPASGVTWTTFTPTDSIPAAAFWTARREKSGLVTTFSDWILLPAAASTSILPFVSHTITGADAPVLGSSNWNTQALQAASSYTGRNFTQLKELGYGTVIAISYPDNTGGAVKISGKYVKGNPQWVTPTEIIDGNLFVDGSIAADKIQTNAVFTNAVNVGAITTGQVAHSPSIDWELKTVINDTTYVKLWDPVVVNNIQQGTSDVVSFNTVGQCSTISVTKHRWNSSISSIDNEPASNATGVRVTYGAANDTVALILYLRSSTNYSVSSWNTAVLGLLNGLDINTFASQSSGGTSRDVSVNGTFALSGGVITFTPSSSTKVFEITPVLNENRFTTEISSYYQEKGISSGSGVNIQSSGDMFIGDADSNIIFDNDTNSFNFNNVSIKGDNINITGSSGLKIDSSGNIQLGSFDGTHVVKPDTFTILQYQPFDSSIQNTASGTALFSQFTNYGSTKGSEIIAFPFPEPDPTTTYRDFITQNVWSYASTSWNIAHANNQTTLYCTLFKNGAFLRNVVIDNAAGGDNQTITASTPAYFDVSSFAAGDTLSIRINVYRRTGSGATVTSTKSVRTASTGIVFSVVGVETAQTILAQSL